MNKQKSFMDFIDKKERDGLSAPVVVRNGYSAPVDSSSSEPCAIITTAIHNTNEDSDDQELLEAGWKFRNGRWLDPITRVLVSWEVAFALYGERERVGTQVQQHRKSSNPYEHRADKEPVYDNPNDIMSRSMSILDDDGSSVPSAPRGRVTKMTESPQFNNYQIDQHSEVIDGQTISVSVDGGTRPFSPTAGLDMAGNASEWI